MAVNETDLYCLNRQPNKRPGIIYVKARTYLTLSVNYCSQEYLKK